ncbi:MAG: hypothetical protein HY852_00320 [Bradyrhizobium sp.]|uniref:hypothetical protein n=1 Tax=Bradyrhizobium sp. TaxID=376 RepID=UPI0025C13D19|nr:hypothetical protein [Bradyrhizobium sp.]MBI5260246.1 hypothetical protein [Bradyrhizobium sp.]
MICSSAKPAALHALVLVVGQSELQTGLRPWGKLKWNVVRERARTVLHPEQAEMQQALNKALAEVQEGMAAAKRALLDRCEMQEYEEGKFRSLREPPPGRPLSSTFSLPANAAAHLPR